MKLLIDNDLIWESPILNSDTDEFIGDVSFLKHLQQLAKKFGIYSELILSAEKAIVNIPAQKTCLDEISMNELFHDFFEELFDTKISYCHLGGAGCEFAILMDEAIARPFTKDEE